MKEKILVGLSGGVDSAVSAYLLKKDGYDVTAGFMINYLAPDGEYCPTKEDIEEAKKVAKFLDIPFFTFDYREEYEKKVLSYMYEGYKKGITPNPDIMCNSEIKFKVFLEEALDLGYDKVATGHYARIEFSPLSPLLQERGTKLGNKQIGIIENYKNVPNYVKILSREFRKKQTKSENILWEILRNRKLDNLKFRRQYAFGRYISDFYCHKKRLVIELDGEIHNSTQKYDKIRDEIIEKYGVYILRIKNKDLFDNLEGVIKQILNSPSPAGEGVRGGGNLFHLLKGVDETKDQSYFLAGLNQFQLSKSLFPIGNLEKKQVRKIAEEIGLPNAKRKDSQGICFVGKVDMSKFLEKKIKPKIGNILDTSGKVLGQHKGVYYYTIGQRKGLDLGGQKEPVFVVRKNLEKNEIIVGTGDDLDLYSDSLVMNHIHFLGKEDFKFPIKVKCKIRYRQRDQDCIISKLDNGRYKVKFKEKQRAIASGQICAVYLGDELIISGVII